MKMQDVDEIENQVKEKTTKKKSDLKVEKDPIISDKENYWEIDDLPSRGYFYDGPVYGRPLKIIDIKKLSSLNEVNGDQVINDIIKRNVKGINVDDLLVGDKMYIVMWLRANSYRNPDYVVDFDCPHCGKKSSYHFELKNINVKYLPDDFNDECLTIKLPNKDDIRFRFTTIKDQRTISNFIKANRELYKGDMDSDLVEVAVTIETINHEQLTDLKKYNYVLGLDPENYAFYQTEVQKYESGIEQYFNVTCGECEEVSPMGVTFRTDFFVPKYKSRDNK
jgi:hypothetical protein